jgi:Uma2 family endonuclease
MSSLPKQFYSADEYLALERSADYKSEYVTGEIFAMGGASPKHVLIASNIAREVGNKLKDKPCQVYASDLRIQADTGSAYFYPDVAVVCGRPEYRDGKHDTVTNPIVIIEVLSPMTRNYDRGDKFAYYRRLASLREYILIDQEPCHIEQYVRTKSGFEFSEIEDCQADLIIPTLDIKIPLAEVYAKVAMLDIESSHHA